MTVTPEQRRQAQDIAAQRDHMHQQQGHQRVTLGQLGKLSHYIGLLGEFATYNILAKTTKVDLTFKPFGDGGTDLKIHRVGRWWDVDVKTSSYTGPEPYLRVPERTIKRDTIYVAVLYDKDSDDAYPRCWDWGVVLINGGERKEFTRAAEGMVPRNYVRPYRLCRPMFDLFGE